MRRTLVLVGLALVLGVSGALVASKERLLASGTVVLLELAPVDPRSLMQGDYMRLDYAIARDLSGATDTQPETGELVVGLDSAGVARFVRRHDSDGALAPGEHLLRYRRRGSRVRIGTDAFYFQEGTADRYARARYGEVRVARDGASVLVGLRDSAGVRLGSAR